MYEYINMKFEFASCDPTSGMIGCQGVTTKQRGRVIHLVVHGNCLQILAEAKVFGALDQGGKKSALILIDTDPELDPVSDSDSALAPATLTLTLTLADID